MAAIHPPAALIDRPRVSSPSTSHRSEAENA